MSMSNCTRLAWKYRWHWNRKLLSLSGSVLLKVLRMWALVPLVLVLGLEVLLALRVLVSQPSTLANCSLVFSLQQGLCYKLKTLEFGQKSKPYIGLTQENLIENSVQDCLSYIQIPNGLCKLFLAYPKQPCVCLKVNMCITYCMMLSFQNLLCSSMCHVTCDCVIWCDLLCDSVILSL